MLILNFYFPQFGILHSCLPLEYDTLLLLHCLRSTYALTVTSSTFVTLSMQKNQEPVNEGQKQRLIPDVNMATEVGIFNHNDWLLTAETKCF